MREYETQMLQKKYRSKEFFGTSSAVPSQNTSSNKERHVYVPRRPRRKSIRQREIKTIKQQNQPAEEKVVVEKKKRGRKPKNRDNAVKNQQPPKSRTHSEVNSNLNSTPNSITIPTSKLRKRKAIQEEEKEKPHISVSHNSSKHVTEKASTPESFSGASHKRRRTKMEHMNQNYIKNSNQNYYYQNGEKVVPQNFQKNDHYQNNHARNEYYQQHMNKRDQKYRRKAYEAYQMYNREPYQWPRYEPPQCDFRANLKLLPFVLQLDDCSLHLISDREIQYLNQTRNLQNSLTKFAYQNGGYSAIPSPNQIPQDEYSFMMVKMKRSYPQPHDNQYLYREEYPTHSRPSFPYQYEREQMQYQNPYHGKTKGSERAHEGMQAHFEN